MQPFHDPQLRFRSAPTLETERLRLRAFELRDLDYFTATYSDEWMTRFIGGVNDGENCWRKMLAASALWPLTGLGMWVVATKDDDTAIGHVGFFDFLRPMQPNIAGKVEMGWVIAAAGHGKGYAGEACRSALDWFDAQFPGEPIYALISPGNDPSMRVAEKLGFTRQPDGIYRDSPQTIWLRTA